MYKTTTRKIDATNYTIRRHFGTQPIEELITNALVINRCNNLQMNTTDGVNYNVIKENAADDK